MNYMTTVLKLSLALLLVTACAQRSDKDRVLNAFSETMRLAPTDSIALEAFEILAPEDVAVHHDGWFIVRKSMGTNTIDLINPESGERIECFRKGRGPGEILLIGPIQYSDGRLYVYDLSREIYYTLDVDATIHAGRQVLRQEFKLGSDDDGHGSFNQPYFLFRGRNAIMATGIFPEGLWYGILDDSLTKIKSGVPLVEYRTTRNMSEATRSAFQLSSYISFSPDGRRGVCAMLDCGTFSLFETDGNTVTEYFRKIYYEPKLIEPSGEIISPGYDKSNLDAFHGAETASDRFYLLFSGKPVGDRESPSSECSHLLVYDWNGNPVRRYELEKSVSSIYLHDGRIYGTSMYPESRIYVYELPPQEDSVHGSVARPGR